MQHRLQIGARSILSFNFEFVLSSQIHDMLTANHVLEILSPHSRKNIPRHHLPMITPRLFPGMLPSCPSSTSRLRAKMFCEPHILGTSSIGECRSVGDVTRFGLMVFSGVIREWICNRRRSRSMLLWTRRSEHYCPVETIIDDDLPRPCWARFCSSIPPTLRARGLGKWSGEGCSGSMTGLLPRR